MKEIDYIIEKIPGWAGRFKGPLGLIFGFFMVFFLGATDYLTGPELSFSIFYLLPVSMVVLTAGYKWGMAISLLSASVWCAADILAGHLYSHPAIPFWNAVVRLGYFLVHTLLLQVLMLMMRRIRDLALKDPMTGAYNGRYFGETAQRELQKARRSGKEITMAYADLDNFKTINDTLGHEAGDELLRRTVELLNHAIRPNDILARMGGDEFALLLPETDIHGARTVLNRVHERLTTEIGASGYPVTISMGAVTFRTIPSSIESLIKKADDLMYTVKKRGKNGLLIIEWPESSGEKKDALLPGKTLPEADMKPI